MSSHHQPIGVDSGTLHKRCSAMLLRTAMYESRSTDFCWFVFEGQVDSLRSGLDGIEHGKCWGPRQLPHVMWFALRSPSWLLLLLR